ncbi:LPS-assembly protein LptD, partial [Psychrobacter sp. 16-Bac2893]
MLYSPLYQSIRLILFGALGLSSLTVSAAINQTDSMMPEPLVTDSSNQYADDVATDAGFNNEINQDISYQSDSQQSAAYKEASLSSDATLGNDAAVNNNNITAINDRTKTSQDSRVAPVNTSNAAKAGNRRIDTNDESIQESLKRLAEFYELTPDTNVATSNNT